MEITSSGGLSNEIYFIVFLVLLGNPFLLSVSVPLLFALPVDAVAAKCYNSHVHNVKPSWKIATSNYRSPSMYMAILVCTNVCMYKMRNKNCATFMIKKRDKNHLYYILSYFEIYLSALFFLQYKSKLWLHYYLFANVTQLKSVFL